LNVIRSVAERLRSRLLPCTVVVFERTLDPELFASADGAAGGIVFGVLKDVEQRGDLPPSLRELVRTRLRQERCFVARDGDRIVGWGFAAVPSDGKWPIGETRSEFSLPAPGVCLTGFVVVEPYRGRGIYRNLINYMISNYAREGERHAYIWCLDTNTPSFKAILSQSFHEIERHEFRFFGTRMLVSGIASEVAPPTGS
jgi:GNAT superfamily N-acetyltransferase